MSVPEAEPTALPSRRLGYLQLAAALLLWLLAVLTTGLGFYLFPLGFLLVAYSYSRARRDVIYWLGLVLAMLFFAWGAVFVVAVQVLLSHSGA